MMMVKKERVSVLYTHLVAAVSSIQDLICLKFRLSMEADVLTSVFISMAMAPTPTALICMMSCFFLSCLLSIAMLKSFLLSSEDVPTVTIKFDTPMTYLYEWVMPRMPWRGILVVRVGEREGKICK